MPIVHDPDAVPGQVVHPNAVPDRIDSDPALGTQSFVPAEALARAVRSGIDCLGVRHFTEAAFTDRLAKVEEAVAVAVKQGVPDDLARYEWLVNGFSITDPFDYSGPKRFVGRTLADVLVEQQRASTSGGAPSGGTPGLR